MKTSLKFATSPDILVADETVLVAISSPEISEMYLVVHVNIAAKLHYLPIERKFMVRNNIILSFRYLF